MLPLRSLVLNYIVEVVIYYNFSWSTVVAGVELTHQLGMHQQLTRLVVDGGRALPIGGGKAWLEATVWQVAEVLRALTALQELVMQQFSGMEVGAGVTDVTSVNSRLGVCGQSPGVAGAMVLIEVVSGLPCLERSCIELPVCLDGLSRAVVQHWASEQRLQLSKFMVDGEQLVMRRE